jgi:ATP/maltotriose-dependent transcriptional regulator MalT
MWAHCALGETSQFAGQLPLARTHLEQSLAPYTPQPGHAYGFVYNPRVLCLSTLALVLHHLGYPEQALQSSKQALTLAQELSQPYNLVIASSFAALVHRVRGELHAAYEFEEAKSKQARLGH